MESEPQSADIKLKVIPPVQFYLDGNLNADALYSVRCSAETDLGSDQGATSFGKGRGSFLQGGGTTN